MQKGPFVRTPGLTRRSASPTAAPASEPSAAAATRPVGAGATLSHRHFDDVAAEVLAGEPVDGRAGGLDVLVSDRALALILSGHLVLVHPDPRQAGAFVRLQEESWREK